MLEMGIDPSYALDRMKMYELRALLDHRHMRHKTAWETARLTAFVSANCAGAKLEELEDLVRFPWEKESGNKKAMTAEEHAEMSARAAMMARMLSGE